MPFQHKETAALILVGAVVICESLLLSLDEVADFLGFSCEINRLDTFFIQFNGPANGRSYS